MTTAPFLNIPVLFSNRRQYLTVTESHINMFQTQFIKIRFPVQVKILCYTSFEKNKHTLNVCVLENKFERFQKWYMM